LHGLGQMLGGDTVGAVEVGDGARDFENAVVGARAQPHAPHRHFERALAGGIKLAQPPQIAGWNVGVIVAASLLNLPRRADTIAHLGGRNAAILTAQLLVSDGGHLDVQIDAVQQRAAELAQIALNDGAGAPALVRGIAVKSARASVQITTATLSGSTDKLPSAEPVEPRPGSNRRLADYES
jgi:hypothetical protein